MKEMDCESAKGTLDSIGMRTTGLGIGFLALLRELIDARVLDEAAIDRIKDAIVTDVATHRPRVSTRAEYEAMVRERMDTLLPRRAEAA